MKILLIEDEPSLRELIQRSLEKERYVVEAAADFQSGLRKIEDYDYDCVLLDIMLPDGNGLNLLEQLKKMRKRENVIIISAKDSLDDKVLGLELGADDYLPKPFHLAELNARIKSVIRRQRRDGEMDIRLANIRIVPDTFQVFVDDKEIELNRKEYDILLYFANRPGRLVNKNTLAESVWGDHIDQVDNFDFIYAQIKNLRKKLKDAGATADDEEVVKPAENAFPYTEGIYYGTGEGYLGDLTAAVVIQDKTIKAILITESEDDEAFLGRAKKVASDIVEKQTVEVDTVSGATYSSVGILDAVKDALKKAEDVTNGKTEPDQKPDDSNKGDDKKDDNTTGDDKKDDNTGGDDKKDDNTGGGDKDPDDDLVYTDGTYEVTVSCDPIVDEDGDSDFDPYHLTMKVTISKDQITAITDIVGDGAEDNAPYLKKAINGTSKQKGVVAQILEKGKPEDIDTVSKATCSSRSIIEGCRKALEAAKREATP